MDVSNDDAIERNSTAHPKAWIGILSGVTAGAAYLVAQMSFAATVHGGDGWEPLQRIAAMLLGPDVVAPPRGISGTIVGMALLIHIQLSAAYGRIIDWAVAGLDTVLAAIVGGNIGMFMYMFHRWLIAPLAFPWFEESNNIVTAIDHVMFGLVAAVSCVQLRRVWATK